MYSEKYRNTYYQILSFMGKRCKGNIVHANNLLWKQSFYMKEDHKPACLFFLIKWNICKFWKKFLYLT